MLRASIRIRVDPGIQVQTRPQEQIDSSAPASRAHALSDLGQPLGNDHERNAGEHGKQPDQSNEGQ